MRNWIVKMLLRAYSAQWRGEYGPELKDMLLARPLTAGIFGDVFLNAMRQRLAQPSTVIGSVMMLVVLVGLVENVALAQHPLGSNLYVLFLVSCGFWTIVRHGGDLDRPGRVAMKISCMAGIPVMLAGFLMLTGVLSSAAFRPVDARQFCWLRVSDPTSPWQGLRDATCSPAPLGVVLAPFVTLFQSYMWGLVGGVLGRVIRRFRGWPLISS